MHRNVVYGFLIFLNMSCHDVSCIIVCFCNTVMIPRCSSFQDMLVSFCELTEAGLDERSVLCIIWCTAGCHRSVTFGCALT